MRIIRDGAFAARVLTVLTLLGIALVLVSGCSADGDSRANDSPVGRWRVTTSSSPNAVGTVWDFEPGGVLRVDQESISWKLEGDTLTLTEDGEEFKTSYTISGDGQELRFDSEFMRHVFARVE